MIYTDGIGTIANVREDSGLKVMPHKGYIAALGEDASRLAREDSYAASNAFIKKAHPTGWK
jgi:hypothetical protein